MPDAKPAAAPAKPHLSAFEAFLAIGTGALATWVIVRPTPAPTPTQTPAGQALPDVSGLFGGQAGVDRIAQQLGATIAPILQADTNFQHNLGSAIGQEVGRQFRVPVYLAAGALAIGAIALVYGAVK